MTLEAVIRTAIGLGAETHFSDWDNRLTLTEAPHLLYRSWS